MTVEELRSDLRWAIERVALVWCVCPWDEEGNPPADCRCDERPDLVRYRKIKERLGAA